MIEGWPVQFLPPTGPLLEEAIGEAVETDLEGERTFVLSAEHLVAIALQTNRAKDKARILQFVEAGVHEYLQTPHRSGCGRYGNPESRGENVHPTVAVVIAH